MSLVDDVVAELEFLRGEGRDRITALLAAAKGNDDAYAEARIQQAFVEGKIIDLQTVLETVLARSTSRAALPDIARPGSVVTVTIGDGPAETLTIVERAEIDPGQGRISKESPIGKAILGHQEGDEVVVDAPAGDLRVRIISLR